MLFVGYQAQGSLGRKLQDGAKSVRLFGEEIAVNAKIRTLSGTSGHADRDGLLRWISGIRTKPELIFVNHGDEEACEAFRGLLEERGHRAEAPYSGTEYDLLTGKMTAYAEGKRIDRTQQLKKGTRAYQLYRDLVAAAEELLALAKTCMGRSNKDNSKLTDQIRALTEKWR